MYWKDAEFHLAFYVSPFFFVPCVIISAELTQPNIQLDLISLITEHHHLRKNAHTQQQAKANTRPARNCGLWSNDLNAR